VGDLSVARQKSDFFLFPLVNVNLFPTTTKPLQIIEDRYVKMVHDSIAQTVPIALCFVPDGSTEIRPIAGYGHPHIIETRGDGTLIIFIMCIGKVELELAQLKSFDPYMIASGQIIEQDLNVKEENRPSYLKLSHVLARWIKDNITDAKQMEIFLQNLTGPTEVVSAFSAYLVLDFDLQYEIMQLTSINEQIKLLYRLLESGELTNT
jgi:Lon protease-like protein